MSADVDLSPSPDDEDYPSRAHRVRAARDKVADAMRALDITEDGDLWREAQETYFALEARVLALDPIHQNVDLSGTDVNASNGNVRVMDGISVADPENPTTTHGVTLDHAVTENEVRFEVNGVPIEDVATRPGSHIP